MIEFKSYEQLRKEVEANEKEREDSLDNHLRVNLASKIESIINRMAAQQKTNDYVEFPWLGPLAGGSLAGSKEEARRKKISAELQAALEKSDWIIVEPTDKGFGIKRK